jgi:hypothetical protein
MIVRKAIQSMILVSFIGFSFSAQAVDVAKADWTSSMSNLLPAAFCQDNSVFRECYKQSAEECHAIATQATASCLTQFSPQLPAVFHQPEDGTNWGRKVGECAGVLFALQSKKAQVDSPRCKAL